MWAERMRGMSMNEVLHSFAYCLDYLREQVADVTHLQMVAQPNGIVNHPAWTMGHLVHSCEEIGGVIGVARWLPADWAKRFGTGSVPVADVGAYEGKEQLLEKLRDGQGRVTRAVEGLDEGRLEAPFPNPAYRVAFPTVRHALTQVLVAHVANHVGQVIVWRRAMGLRGMGRGFE